MSYAPHPEPSAPHMYPTDQIRPIPPVRSEFSQDPQQQSLLPPRPPVRMDKQPTPPQIICVESRRNDSEKNTDDENNDCTFNYNRYATIKTIGHILLEVALLTSNAMQFRTLILQKQHDGIWIASLILVCISILSQFGLAFLLYLIIKDDIGSPQKQSRLERLNTLAFVIIIIISIINILINIFMLTINPKSFLDSHSLEILQQQQKTI